MGIYKETAEHVEYQNRRAFAAIRTLQRKGYTYHGGEEWKPPIGPPPDFAAYGLAIEPPRIEQLSSDDRQRERKEIREAQLAVFAVILSLWALAIVCAIFERSMAVAACFMVSALLMLLIPEMPKKGQET